MSQADLEADPEYRKWVASRPPKIREAIKRYPVGSTFEHDGQVVYLLGWAESSQTDDVILIFSRVDPAEDYDLAVAPQNKVRICAKHIAPVQ